VPSAPNSTFDQLIDHRNTSRSTFPQRYCEVNRSLPNESSQVRYAILSVGGESDDFGADGNDGLVGSLAEILNASVFTPEHRFFGTSFPVQDTSTATFADLHNVDQALADFAYFANKTQRDRGWPSDVRWLVVGGSYSGAVSALLRQNYSDVFWAAWSSSGVVLANDNYADFDLQIAITMGQECASVARSVRLQIEEMWENNESHKWMLHEFGCDDLETPEDFLFVLGDIFSLGGQYSNAAQLCDPLVDTLRMKNDPFMVLARYSKDYFVPSFCDGNCSASYSRDVMRRQANETSNVAPRSWQWMTCNELGYWQVSPGRLSIRPKNLARDWFAQQCADIFYPDDNVSLMYPNVTEFNRKYGGLNQQASRVFYSTGSQDPWTWSCVTEESGAPAGSIAHTITGPEMGHCSDWGEVNTDSAPDLVRTVEYEKAMLLNWMLQGT
jgi:pimeloyl-ACP methyl ester carboxylesterase